MDKLLSAAIFLGLGLFAVFAGLAIGRLFRPRLPSIAKSDIYECGERTIGSSWSQFDPRFYIVALFYLVFDVEVALTYPLAAVFRQVPEPILLAAAPFLAVIILGYAYEWYAGSLEWVRSDANTSARRRPRAAAVPEAKES